MGNRQENRLSVVNPHFPDGIPNKVIVIELEKRMMVGKLVNHKKRSRILDRFLEIPSIFFFKIT
jgi:hypothetical protein